MDLAPDLKAALWRTAEAVADAAAAQTLPLFRSRGLDTDNKAEAGFDPVTAADRAAEQAMREVLGRQRPQDGILGEEFAPVAARNGLTWVLDPIDGTRAFLSGAPTWGTLIGLDAGAGPLIGLIDQPYIGERFMGGLGRAELRSSSGAATLSTRPCSRLRDAILYTTFPAIGTETQRMAFERVRDRVRLTRYGFDCYAYALVALGHVDLVIEAGLQSYDIQGPMAVVAAAGGIVTDWQGGSAHMGGEVIAAGDTRVHAAALELLSGVT